ncbi:MAG TPA: hypothetical protein VE733_13015, partial [Streptosporangiaceae bacterium]|nr:hypothetical protein [Streptosporangiaceae bacterium]
MTGRSGWDIGRKARELLVAARQAGSGAAIASPPAPGTAIGTAGAAVAKAPAASVAIADEAPAGPAAASAAAANGAAVTAAHEANGASRMPEDGTGAREDAARAAVPRWLQTAGGWSWRLLFIGIVLYMAYRVAGRLAVVVVPCAAALLLTALLQPLTSRLHRAGLPMLAAAWCTLLSAVIVLAGTITLVTVRVRDEYPGLVIQVRHTSHELQKRMAYTPLHLQTGSLQKLSD